MNCPECGGYLVDDVLEDIEIRKDGIYMDANEIFKCNQCGYMEYNSYDDEKDTR